MTANITGCSDIHVYIYGYAQVTNAQGFYLVKYIGFGYELHIGLSLHLVIGILFGAELKLRIWIQMVDGACVRQHEDRQLQP